MSSAAPFSDDDEAAVLALLARYHELWVKRAADRELKAQVEARLEQYRLQFEKVQTALDIFGVDSRTDEGFGALRERVGVDKYDRALFRRLGGLPAPVVEQPLLFGPPDDLPTRRTEISNDGSEAPSSVREYVIENLKAAASKGRKAADIRRAVEAWRGTKLHDKTIGMTLYRLSQETPPLARREGTTWFYVPPPEAETKNPGGETPAMAAGVADHVWSLEEMAELGRPVAPETRGSYRPRE